VNIGIVRGFRLQFGHYGVYTVHTEAYMGVIETKTFKSGNSVAVRLPKGLGFEADMPVTIEQVGDSLRITPVSDAAEGKRRVRELVEALLAMEPVGEIEKRIPIEFPDRPGLY
jgi:antitoxin VapB